MHVEDDLRPIIATKIAIMQTARQVIHDTAPNHYIILALDDIIHNEIEAINAIDRTNEA